MKKPISLVVDRTLIPKRQSSPEMLASEARRGLELTKALVHHLSLVGASGYSNDLIVDGETWVIQITKESIP